MDILNFSSFAKSIKKGMPKSPMIEITKLLLGLIVNNENVLNINGEPYTINSYYNNRWWHQFDDIPKSIKEAAASTEIMSKATAYFDEEIMTKLSPQKESDMYSSLIDLINDDVYMSENTRNKLLKLYKENDLTEFLKETFLYAIQKNNKAPDNSKDKEHNEKAISSDILEDVNKLEELLQAFPRPISIIPPEDLKDDEMTYISELLAAYAEHAGVDVIDKDKLGDYPNYKKNFERQRKDYYAAETIRQSARDTLTFCKNDEFLILKEETYDGVIDVCEDDYENGFDRLKSVMKHVTTVQLNKSLLCKLPGWISNSEKKGVCHMIVDDGDIKWVNDYD